MLACIDRCGARPTSALAPPMLFYELGRLARVVESDGILVGFLLGFTCRCVEPEETIGSVTLVATHPDDRRRGVARLLCSAFEQDCLREGVRRLKAITTLGNEGSVR